MPDGSGQAARQRGVTREFVKRISCWLPPSLKRLLRNARGRGQAAPLVQSSDPLNLDRAWASPSWIHIDNGPCCGINLYLSRALREAFPDDYDSFIYKALDEAGFRFDGAIVWDVGAHVGYHSLAMAKRIGTTGRVVAFEPNPVNAERFLLHLDNNLDVAGRIELRKCALSNLDGQHSLRFIPDANHWLSACSFLDKGSLPGDRMSKDVYARFETTTVATAKADTLLEKGNVPAPTLMKVDVEGAEVEVLEGSRALLSKHRPVIAMEVHNVVCMFGVQDLLHQHSYKLKLLNSGESSSSRCFILATPCETTSS
jgi:FkbM family methyltransferase